MNINRYHIYFWSLHFSFLFILDYLYFKESFIAVREFYMMFMQLSIFYSFLFALVKFRKGSIRNWGISISLFLLSFGFILFLNHLRGKLATYYNPDNILHESFGILVNETLSYYNVLALYATGYYFLMRYGTKQKELRQLAEEKAAADLANAEMQQHMLVLENDFLRAQINPHFLNNTLNALNAKALPLSQELADDVVALAGIMRYSLLTSRGHQLMPLHMEVEHLERVIALYRLRYGSSLCLQFIKEGPYEQYSVAPLVLITLVENAMKHGVVTDPAQPITIQLAATGTHIHFSVRNKVGPPTIDPSHGIGLNNIRKRLAYIYGSRCHLRVTEANGHYEALLEIEHGGVDS